MKSATDIRDEEVDAERTCACVFCLTQQYSRGNNTVQTSSLKDLLQNKIDDMEKQVLSRVNTLEETKGASRNDSEQRNKVETTLTSLHHRITDLEKGAFAPRLSASRLRWIYFAAERSCIAAHSRRFSERSRTAHARKLCRARLALRNLCGVPPLRVRAHWVVKWCKCPPTFKIKRK